MAVIQKLQGAPSFESHHATDEPCAGKHSEHTGENRQDAAKQQLRRHKSPKQLLVVSGDRETGKENVST